MEGINKTRTELAIRNLESRAAKIEDVPYFRGIPATEFDKEHLVMLCSVFASEWHKAQEQYYAVLGGAIQTYKARAKAVCAASYKPSVWSKKWNKIKKN